MYAVFYAVYCKLLHFVNVFIDGPSPVLVLGHWYLWQQCPTAICRHSSDTLLLFAVNHRCWLL